MSATIDSSSATPIGSTPATPAGTSTLEAVLQAISQSLERRGYLTTEFWTTLFVVAL